jgi:exopolyphosphatase/guanosine-5'-triphosphate,3'-diphosphate pyrophosphatase
MSRVAAIDCGTNSIRLLVAEASPCEGGTVALHDVTRQMRIVRLGQGVDASGRLTDEALRRTEEALSDYAATASQAGAELVRMVATSAARDAANRDEFFAMTERLLGRPAEVITGDEEARLSFVGAVGDSAPQDGPFLVVDVGGGSTELVRGEWDGRDATVHAARSVDVGSVRLTERCLGSDPPSDGEVAAATRLATELLGPPLDAVSADELGTWIGVAGTVTTLAAIAAGLPEYDPARIHLARLTLEQVSRTVAALLEMNHDGRAAIGPMHPGRVDVIGAGGILVRVLAEELAARAGITTMTASEKDILDGIAMSLA